MFGCEKENLGKSFCRKDTDILISFILKKINYESMLWNKLFTVIKEILLESKLQKPECFNFQTGLEKVFPYIQIVMYQRGKSVSYSVCFK